MAVYQYKSYGNQSNPQKMVIFIHGYKSSMDDVAKEAQALSQASPQSVVITPQSDIFSSQSMSRQWYNISEYDVQHKRRNPETPVDEVVDIYTRSGEQLSLRSAQMNRFISEMQDFYKIIDQDTYIAGFSQGAMLAIYTSLSRLQRVGGCFALSGIVAGKDKLATEINSRPQVYMLHGKNDNTVQYKTLDFSVDWLRRHNIAVKDIRYDNMAHIITPGEVNFIAETINTSLL